MFGSKELPRDQPVFVGKSEKSVCFRMGAWSFLFAIESEARFPNIDDHVRCPNDATSTIQFSAADAAFLRRSLRNLPCDDEFNYPVTVDLNGCLAVRAKSADAPHPVELVFSRSTSTGQDVCINTNRKYLGRAIQLGFREILTLFFLEDLSTAEIAAVVGIPSGTVKSRLHHAKKTLRAVLLEGANHVA